MSSNESIGSSRDRPSLNLSTNTGPNVSANPGNSTTTAAGGGGLSKFFWFL